MDLMQLSDLLDNNDNREIDLPGTRKNVINFFNNQYQKLKYLANISPLNSVSYDNIKVQTSQSNSIEDKTIRQLQAKEYLRIVDDCINSLDDIKKTIFQARVIKNLYHWQIVKPDYYIFIAWCSWFTNYNLTWLRYDIIWMQVFIYTLT